jgi:hypothetical protein
MLQVLYVFGMLYGGVVVSGRVYGTFTFNITCLTWLISLPRCIQAVALLTNIRSLVYSLFYFHPLIQRFQAYWGGAYGWG